MPIMKIIRAADGSVINIGPWDYRIGWVGVTDDQGQQIYDRRPDGGYVERQHQIATNPLPPGAYEDEAEVIVRPDGGLMVVGG